MSSSVIILKSPCCDDITHSYLNHIWCDFCLVSHLDHFSLDLLIDPHYLAVLTTRLNRFWFKLVPFHRDWLLQTCSGRTNPAKVHHLASTALSMRQQLHVIRCSRESTLILFCFFLICALKGFFKFTWSAKVVLNVVTINKTASSSGFKE